MARPKKAETEKPTEQINLRCTTAEIETVRENAARAGLSVSDYTRSRAVGIPVRAQSSAMDPALIVALNKIGNNVNQLARASHRGRDSIHSWEAVQYELRAVLHDVLDRVD